MSPNTNVKHRIGVTVIGCVANIGWSMIGTIGHALFARKNTGGQETNENSPVRTM